jgi:hypothetical protein
MVLLGELPASPFPGLDGYNLTYLRPGATMGVITTDEYEAPVLAFWHRGLGRVAALTAEVDGQYSPRLNAWRDFQGFAVGLGRWLLGGEPPSGVQAGIERQGAQGIVRVQLDPGRTRGGADDVRAATATIVAPDAQGDGALQRLPLAWIGEDTLEARFPIQKAGMYLGAVQLGSGSVLPLAPLSLPYSPEFELRQDPKGGQKTLSEMARITGGIERTAWDDLFDESRLRTRQVRDLVIPLTMMLLVLHVAEIGGRRLFLFAAVWRLGHRLVRRSAERKDRSPQGEGGWLRNLRLPGLRRVAPEAETASAASTGAKAAARSGHIPTAAAEETPRVAPPKSASSPLARAKAKARDRMGG